MTLTYSLLPTVCTIPNSPAIMSFYEVCLIPFFGIVRRPVIETKWIRVSADLSASCWSARLNNATSSAGDLFIQYTQ